MTSDALAQMTVKDLRALAERHGLSLPSKLRKDQVIALLVPLVEDVPAVKPIPVPIAAPAGSSAVALAAAPAPVMHQGPDPGLPIPDQYGVDRIVLLVQDPHHLFAYWEISAATHQRACLAAGQGATPVLLVEGEHGTEQREIDLRGGNYYLAVAPGVTYRARLALRSKDGRLHALCADSNVASTPAVGPSARHDEAWMQVDEHFHELLERSGAGAGAGVIGESSLNRLLKRTLSTREVAVGEDHEGSLAGGDLGGLDAGAAGGPGGESSAARLMRKGAAAGFSSHSLLSSHALAAPAGLGSHSLGSHSLSSHSLSSTVFSSHSRWSTTPVFIQENPGLPAAPAGGPGASTPTFVAAPAPSATPAVTSGPALVGTPAPAPTAAAPTVAAPPPRPGQIKGLETIKTSPARRRPR